MLKSNGSGGKELFKKISVIYTHQVPSKQRLEKQFSCEGPVKEQRRLDRAEDGVSAGIPPQPDPGAGMVPRMVQHELPPH